MIEIIAMKMKTNHLKECYCLWLPNILDGWILHHFEWFLTAAHSCDYDRCRRAKIVCQQIKSQYFLKMRLYLHWLSPFCFGKPSNRHLMNALTKRHCCTHFGLNRDDYAANEPQIHPLTVQSAPKEILNFQCNRKRLNCITFSTLTPHDWHSRKRRRLYCRSSKSKIKFTISCSGVLMISTLLNSSWMLQTASRSKSAICWLIWILSMFEKNLKCRTNKPASAVKKFICQHIYKNKMEKQLLKIFNTITWITLFEFNWKKIETQSVLYHSVHI